MKKKVVHTRIPEELFDEIVSKAKRHRTTVSGLMRNLLEDFLDISEDMTDLMADKTRNMFFGDEAMGDLIASQPLTIEKETVCSICQEPLLEGESAYLAFYENTPRGVIVCKTCKKEVPPKKTSARRRKKAA